MRSCFRWGLLAALQAVMFGGVAIAQNHPLVFERDGRVISLVPYAPNVLRVTISTDKTAATGGPGYGIVATPSAEGWTHERDAEGNDVFRSAQMVVRIAPGDQPNDKLPQPMPLDALNNQLREHYFGGRPNPYAPHNDAVLVTAADGKPLLHMRTWTMAPERAEVAQTDTATEKGYRVAAIFDSPADEHYYGLGQQQKGWMDLRDHEIHCWHEYSAIGGQDVCVPFMISSRGYGLVWDNPSKTTVDLGFNGQNVWSSEVGSRVSYFVIAGQTSDEIYEGYRLLTGVTHMLPRAVYGYIQSKAIYPTQQQILDVAKTYREKKLPLDVVVVDFLNMTKQGELDLDPKRWPDPAAMNQELHAMDVRTLLSVWPHFAPGTQFYDMLLNKGWLVHTRDGKPDSGTFKDAIGPNIDTTNPDAAKWFWEKIRDRYVKPYGFDYIWLDETEPDVDPAKDVFSIGSGTRFYNAYPLFHTASVYEGFRRDFGDSRRVMILARAAYLGAQRNGTVFWSSDIISTWDMLKRSVPAGLNFTASGLPYWDTDIAGFFSPAIPAGYHAAHKPLIDGSDVRENIGNYEDYPELFVRWFEWASFQPVMRAHGERMHNEVWSYGKQAEPILAKYLKLRYQLLPYTYSVAYQSYQTGAPYIRALFMDFPADPKAADIPDEYMYGPAFLVAPVTEQGATHRTVYLPAGCDWYNYWTNERVHGGQTIVADAPIDTLPLFVRAGSIVPVGSEVQSAQQSQTIASVRVYPGASGSFTLFQDDGATYTYEKTGGSVTKLMWDDAEHQLKHEGASAWAGTDESVVQVVGR
ncbi:glycoside hydrolase family 31 protein [Alloacidobacterium dinghuense]|uniref:Glycoside hydrolase family 31 protein n=1 Tax=Alloacidobacterium dinghuense TaxID=2763107 RepID=A0A7G8BHT0_9BACT|nr:TIM-barrel domain-containing protein [Alloacidobacterium dinghuense]QNI32100.1 glycoside hydrolase family 31 protein [Alloacidobacterium dinghuense]